MQTESELEQKDILQNMTDRELLEAIYGAILDLGPLMEMARNFNPENVPGWMKGLMGL